MRKPPFSIDKAWSMLEQQEKSFWPTSTGVTLRKIYLKNVFLLSRRGVVKRINPSHRSIYARRSRRINQCMKGANDDAKWHKTRENYGHFTRPTSNVDILLQTSRPNCVIERVVGIVKNSNPKRMVGSGRPGRRRTPLLIVPSKACQKTAKKGRPSI